MVGELADFQLPVLCPFFAGFVTCAIQEGHCVHNAGFFSHSVQVALALDSERL